MASYRASWIYWGLITAAALIYLTVRLVGEDKSVFLPGKTTHGHYQIEMACAACHSDPFGGAEVLQDACMNCHGAELKRADDSHPKSKFIDPRNASRVAKLDARLCITCHTEHQPEITSAMGVTVAEDFCFHCHQDIADDRPSHAGMEFTTCATGGCHNFHDNTALYEDFLLKHLDEPDVVKQPGIAPRSPAGELVALVDYPVERYPLQSLTKAQQDAPLRLLDNPAISDDWLASKHAEAGVNCSACHETRDTAGELHWTKNPDHSSCQSCHAGEVDGFLAGKHGMRLAQDLSPMTPGQARQPMRESAAHKQLSCTSCHAAHSFDVQHAQVKACLGCHNDSHSLAFQESPHFQLWHASRRGNGDPETAVSCATCHMPRQETRVDGKLVITTQHNQNDNLRPNEKMLRSVCMNCHGLQFALDSLADEDLVSRNFHGKPSTRIESLDMARRRLDKKGEGGDM